MEEEALKRYRERIDEVREFIKKYGKDAALLYLLKLPQNSEEFKIWILAFSDYK